MQPLQRSWPIINKTSVTRGVDLIATITFPTPAQLLPQTSSSGFCTCTSGTAQEVASWDQTNTAELKPMSNATRLPIVKHYCLRDCHPSCAAYVCPSNVCDCVCVCRCQLGVISLSSPCPLMCCQGLQLSLSAHPTHSHLSLGSLHRMLSLSELILCVL